tara:strand:+ start:69 stop:485 length:417 start_codon:yes stop_codon:yes gene_type:complete
MKMNINDLPKYLKNFLINIILFPFWVISIYIFNPELYFTNDFLIIGSLCISLTIISSMIMSYTFMNKEKDETMLEETVIISSLAIQVILLSVIIFLGYLFKKITGYYFEYYSFLSLYFGMSLLFLYIVKFLGKNNHDK